MKIDKRTNNGKKKKKTNEVSHELFQRIDRFNS